MFISTVVGLIYREAYVIFLFHWHLNETIFSCVIVVNGYDPQMFNKDYTNKNMAPLFTLGEYVAYLTYF